MEIEEAIRGYLIADATLSALVGTRVYPCQAPQSGEFPVVLYNEAAQQSIYALAGRLNTNRYAMHLEIYGRSYEDVKDTYQAVRDRLSGFRGELEDGAVTVLGCFEESGDDSAEGPIHAEESGLWRAGLDLSMVYSN